MTLREILKTNFDTDFNISGGMGNSRETPIRLHAQPGYIDVEYQILECIGLLRHVQWELLEQNLIAHEGRALDQLKIKTILTTDEDTITQVENFYFDITDCMEY